jgi:predicted CopG family antitoxin
MTCGRYAIANLTEKELQKLKEAEKSFSNLHEQQNEGQKEQELVLIAYTHGHK